MQSPILEFFDFPKELKGVLLETNTNNFHFGVNKKYEHFNKFMKQFIFFIDNLAYRTFMKHPCR